MSLITVSIVFVFLVVHIGNQSLHGLKAVYLGLQLGYFFVLRQDLIVFLQQSSQILPFVLLQTLALEGPSDVGPL